MFAISSAYQRGKEIENEKTGMKMSKLKIISLRSTSGTNELITMKRE